MKDFLEPILHTVEQGEQQFPETGKAGEKEPLEQAAGQLVQEPTSSDDFSVSGTELAKWPTGLTSSGDLGTSNPDNQDVPQPSGEETHYVQPDITKLDVPSQVAGKTGYEPVKEESRQIPETEARELASQLGVGETGDDLTFDPVFYPFYEMLDESGQHLYRQIYANAQALQLRFVPVERLGNQSVKNVFEAVYNDHPELFWLETAYSCKYVSGGVCVEIGLKTNRTAQNLETAKNEFAQAAQNIVNGAQGLATNVERERFVHDAVLEQTDYRLSAPMNQSAYSALVNGSTVCAGYARAVQYVLQQLGIPCYYCTGFAGENHAWNIVALEDGYYNVDATWDDTGAGQYAYFNKTDADYAGTHVRQDLSINLPPCNGGAYREPDAASEQDNTYRSLADLGLGEEVAVQSLDAYYADCENQMRQAGIGSYQFDSIVAGEDLLQEIYTAYQSDAYRQGYLDETMAWLGATRGSMHVEVEPLQGGYYRISHEVSLRAR